MAFPYPKLGWKGQGRGLQGSGGGLPKPFLYMAVLTMALLALNRTWFPTDWLSHSLSSYSSSFSSSSAISKNSEEAPAPFPSSIEEGKMRDDRRSSTDNFSQNIAPLSSPQKASDQLLNEPDTVKDSLAAMAENSVDFIQHNSSMKEAEKVTEEEINGIEGASIDSDPINKGPTTSTTKEMKQWSNNLDTGKDYSGVTANNSVEIKRNSSVKEAKKMTEEEINVLEGVSIDSYSQNRVPTSTPMKEIEQWPNNLDTGRDSSAVTVKNYVETQPNSSAKEAEKMTEEEINALGVSIDSYSQNRVPISSPVKEMEQWPKNPESSKDSSAVMVNNSIKTQWNSSKKETEKMNDEEINGSEGPSIDSSPQNIVPSSSPVKARNQWLNNDQDTVKDSLAVMAKNSANSLQQNSSKAEMVNDEEIDGLIERPLIDSSLQNTSTSSSPAEVRDQWRNNDQDTAKDSLAVMAKKSSETSVTSWRNNSTINKAENMTEEEINGLELLNDLDTAKDPPTIVTVKNSVRNSFDSLQNNSSMSEDEKKNEEEIDGLEMPFIDNSPQNISTLSSPSKVISNQWPNKDQDTVKVSPAVMPKNSIGFSPTNKETLKIAEEIFTDKKKPDLNTEKKFPNEETRKPNSETDHNQIEYGEKDNSNTSLRWNSVESDLKPPLLDSSKIRSEISDVQKPEWLANLELQISAAKEAISKPDLSVKDEELYPPLYHNVSQFQKSYELMEKKFKIFIYEEGSQPLVHDGPTLGIYATEGRFIYSLEQSQQFVTKDHRKAMMFFLPYSVANMVLKLYIPGSRSMLPLATFIKDYVNVISAKYPFWNQTHGHDHFFVSCHDWGPATARDHEELRKNSVKVVCNADSSEEFSAIKDVSLPEIYIHSEKLPIHLGGPGPLKRPYLAFFAGQMHGRVRPILLKHWRGKDPDMRIYEVLPRSVTKKSSYIDHMRMSKYCICAMGYEVNSPRIVEAIYYGCVPVVIADNFLLPFSDVLNWDAFSLTVAEKDIPRLKEILLSVSARRYQSMQNRLKHVRQHFLWHDSPVKYDVFHMILHSIWLRRLTQIQP